ncbi:MAG TPA: 2-C-methyl-D-erythritol 4-phosphate cytidylyltransferase [Solirubrobacteraceae bacterium]|nr:2-C-methyl-D-erythritol 4-phosphate cytidylyltransferase [Solirubrobacteraceae bacterium]
MAVALIVAAGRGERLGLDRPKALVPLRGRPMLDYSLDALRGVPDVERIVVALPAEAIHAAPDDVVAVAGGVQRSHSVRAALAAAPGAPEDAVIVHDAARPLVSAELFAQALDALARAPEADAVIAAAPVTDTIKEVSGDGRSVARTLDRSRLWAVQTPQVFRRSALERVLAAADDELLAQATDDAWLIERGGGTVHVLGSDPGNLKVTTAHDLRVAELLLAEREAAAAAAPGAPR